MTLEQKAKAYDEAIERAKEELGSGCFNKGSIEYIFPELKESEDEKVRKELFAVINDLVLPKEQLERFNAYLEKVKDFDKQLEEAYKNSDEVQYKRGYDDGYLEGITNAKKELEKQGEMDIEMDIEKPITIGKRRAVSGKLKELIDNKDEKSLAETKKKMLAETSKWTDEDEIGSDATIELLEYFINYAPEFRRPTIRRSIDWLKSLKKRMEE